MIAAAIAAALLAWPVYAQSGAGGYQPKPEEIEKKRNAEALEQRYRNALEQTSKVAAPVKTDPWGNMRGPTDAKAKK